MTTRSGTRRSGDEEDGSMAVGAGDSVSGAPERDLHARTSMPTILTRRVPVREDCDDIVPTFMAGLQACDDVDSICDLVSSVTDKLGIGKFHYLLLPVPGQPSDPASSLQISTIDPEWLTYYREAGFAKYDIWAQTAITRRTPMIWSDIDRSVDMNAVQRRMRAEGAEAGLSDGASIPVRGRTSKALMSFATRTPKKNEIDILKRRLPLLSVIAGLTHTRAIETLIGERAIPGRPSPSLSPRQTEVLQWAAVGKTDWEIAAILNISEKAVKFHFVAARQKLAASNRTHAVAKALSCGAITPV